jgi:2-iminobutanoate/2-iminopropanoate deaminase
LNQRLKSIGLTLESVVKIDCLFRDIWNIPVMEEVVKERFRGKYPARKSLQTEFAHSGGQDGLLFQLDAIAFRG